MFGIGRKSEPYGLPLGSDSYMKEEEQKAKEKEEQQKTNIQIQLTNKEKKIIQEASKKSGLSLSAFIRLTCLNHSKEF
jgi:hypothetical protein